MSRRIFGTDGVRGRANSDPMTAEVALALAMAAGRFFRRGDHHPLAVIGKDTRLSGYLLEPALTAGFVAMGMDVILLGPIPTPAVSMLTRSLRADLGVVISASHNPFEDNGVKMFGPDGCKLSEENEAEIEAMINAGVKEYRAVPKNIGRARRLDDAQGRYIEYVKNTFPRGLRLDGLKIVVDCAHGAAYKVAPRVFWELGADVKAIGDKPDGVNINLDHGAEAPAALARAVREYGADIGVALDGDGDRVTLCDETGKIINGDQIIARLATDFRQSGILRGDGVVATVMSNLGLERFLGESGLSLIRTRVGDRYVAERMRSGGYNLGGEQSGHIVFADFTPTGDGLVAALQILSTLMRSDKSPARYVVCLSLYPRCCVTLLMRVPRLCNRPKLSGRLMGLKNAYPSAGVWWSGHRGPSRLSGLWLNAMMRFCLAILLRRCVRLWKMRLWRPADFRLTLM